MTRGVLVLGMIVACGVVGNVEAAPNAKGTPRVAAKPATPQPPAEKKPVLVPGTGTAMVPTSAGPVAVAISWEVFFPRRVREGVRAGGELVANPTNGSSYWLTQVQTQQVAQSQLRATESGRWLIQAAPTGFSAVIDPRGTLEQRTSIGETAVLTATIDRLTGTTPAQRFGDVPALFLAGGTALALLTAELLRRRESPPLGETRALN